VLSFIGKDPDFPGLFSKRIWVNSSDTMSPRIRVQAKAGRVDVGVQMRRAVHAYKCCPRHNEPFGVLLASPCTLWQPVQPQSATLQRLQLASADLLQWPAFALW